MKRDRQDAKFPSRIFIALPILFVVLWAAAWGGASVLAQRLAHTAAMRMMEQFERQGIGLDDLSFQKARVSPIFNGIEFEGLHARFDLNLRDITQLQSTVETQAAEVRLGSPFDLSGSVRLSGLEIRLDESDLPSSLPFDRFTNAQLSIGNLLLTQPRQSTQDIRRKLKALFIDNEAVGDVEFSGNVKLTLEEV